MASSRRVLCWKCDKVFRVEVEEVKTSVLVKRGDDTQGKRQTAKQKLIVKCPECSKENEVRV